MPEVALRNRIHAVLSQARQPAWFSEDGFLLVPHQMVQIETATSELVREKKEPTPAGIVSALPFNFWTTMPGPAYETLWQTHLHRIGLRENGKGLRRKDFSAPLTPNGMLRNRIAHHAPILAWNLPQHHAAMVRITFWLSATAAGWCGNLDRFELVYPLARLRLLGE
jgi:hypothetical protein